MTTITRVGWCEHCFNRHHPKTEQIFLAFCTDSNRYLAKECIRNGLEGFTPHLYRLVKIENGKAFIEFQCALYGCGVDRQWVEKGGGHWEYFAKNNWRKVIWPEDRWYFLTTLHKTNLFTWQFLV